MKIYKVGANHLTSGSSLDIVYQEIGYNSGNILISHGTEFIIKNYLGSEFELLTWTSEIENTDVLIIAAANWISNTVDLSWLFEYPIQNFERIIVLGLGISNILNYESLSLSSRKFINFLDEKKAIVCTRDSNSKSYLQEFISKVYWTGCPSLRLESLPYIDRDIPNLVGLSGSIELAGGVENSEEFLAYEYHLFNELKNSKNSVYILQAEYNLMELISRQNYEALLAYLEINFNFDFSIEVSKKIKYIINVEEWRKELSTLDYFIGTRLHGNILAEKCGVKPFLVAHDLRTQLFLEDFKFPGCKFVSGLNYEELIIKSDNSKLHDYYEKLLETNENLNKAISIL